MGIVQGAVGSFLIAFPALFSIVNPPGGALIYHQVTADRDHAERVRLAWRVALYATAVMLVALWAGASLIGFFGVTLAALRIGGGLVVAARAWELLSAPQQQEDRKQAQAAPAAGAEDVAFFPLTVPFTSGPGTIAAAIALNANRTHKLSEFMLSSIVSIAVSALVAVVIWLTYSRAALLSRYLGIEGTKVAKRVSAFLLLCIGVQIMLTGFSAFLQPIADQAK